LSRDETVRRHIENGMESPEPVRIVTLNTWKNEGDYAARLGAMAAGLRSLAPDIVLLQEVFRTADGAADTGCFLANALGLTIAYAPARAKLRRWHGHEIESESGLALLARGELARIERLSLPTDPQGGERIALLADAYLADGQHVLAGCVHLSHLRGDSIRRQQQLETILEHRRWREDAGLRVFGGDFNATFDHPEIAWMRSYRGLVITDVFGGAPIRRATHPIPTQAGRAGRCIDFLFTVTPAEKVPPRVVVAGVALDTLIDGIWVSDHAAVVATLAKAPNS
jgi:endonuclease/exonuclease/phosphatase family metal-dependent hydrolase